MRRELLEYDCPNSNIDLDVYPLPAYGSRIYCSACGQEHIADEKLGAALRVTRDAIVDITDEWRASTKAL